MRFGRRMADHIILEDAFDDLAIGQHRHHRIDTRHSLAHRGEGRDTIVLGAVQSLRRQIERVDLMSRLDEISRHPAAHIAKADKCDFHYFILSRRNCADTFC